MPSVTVTALASDSRGLDDGKFTETAMYDIQRHYILGKGNILKKQTPTCCIILCGFFRMS